MPDDKKGFDYAQLAAPGAGAALGAGAGWLLAEPALGLKEKKHKAIVAALGALAGAAAGGAVGAMDMGGEQARREAKLDEAGLGVVGHLSNPLAVIPSVGAGVMAHGATQPVMDKANKLMERPAAVTNRALKGSPVTANVINALRIMTGGSGKTGKTARFILGAGPAVIGAAAPFEISRQIARATTKTD